MSGTALRRAALAATALSLVMPAVAFAQEAPARESTAFTLASDQPRAPEQLAVTFDKADLSIRVLPDDKAIDAVAVLDFATTAPVDRLSVELDTLLTISEVSVDGQIVPADRWSNPEGRLTVQLGRTVPADQTVQLRIAYAGSPRVAPRSPWNGGIQWETTPEGEPWIATAVQGEGCDIFWPCIDHPLAEPGRVDLHITVPSNLAAPANGRFMGKQDHGDGWTTWNWSAANPNTYAISLTVGPYEEKTATYHSRFGNSFPMSYWHLRSDDPAKVDALFAQFKPMLDHYEATVGPYPFGDEKMGVVETPHLGMEHQTINAYGNKYRLDGKGYDWLLHHELAHEWFGNQMTHRSVDDIWLHEGLGTYWQPLYLRTINGERGMQVDLQSSRLSLRNAVPVVSDRDAAPDPALGNDAYSKGALTAHSLRMLIGDEAFFRSVTRLIYGRPDPRPGNFEPRNATTKEFMAIVAEEAGRNLDWFFHGYLYNAGLPKLEERRENGRLMLSWTTGDGRPFPMPVEVEIDGEIQTVPMTDGRGDIAVPEHALVIIDPASKVLRHRDYIDAYNVERVAQAAARAASSGT